jgi:hypothetical protein
MLPGIRSQAFTARTGSNGSEQRGLELVVQLAAAVWTQGEHRARGRASEQGGDDDERWPRARRHGLHPCDLRKQRQHLQAQEHSVDRGEQFAHVTPLEVGVAGERRGREEESEVEALYDHGREVGESGRTLGHDPSHHARRTPPQERIATSA